MKVTILLTLLYLGGCATVPTPTKLPNFGLPPMSYHNLARPFITEALAERIAFVVLDGYYPKEIFVAKPPGSVEDKSDVWLVTVENALPLESGTIRPFHLRVAIRKSNGEILGMG